MTWLKLQTTKTKSQSKTIEKPRGVWADDCPLPYRQENCPASPSSSSHSLPSHWLWTHQSDNTDTLHMEKLQNYEKPGWVTYWKCFEKGHSYSWAQSSIIAIATLEHSARHGFTVLLSFFSLNCETVNILQFLFKCYIALAEWKSSVSFSWNIW